MTMVGFFSSNRFTPNENENFLKFLNVFRMNLSMSLSYSHYHDYI